MADMRAFERAGGIGTIEPPRPTVAMTLEQAMQILGEAEHVAFTIAAALLGPTPQAGEKPQSPVGIVGAANEVRNRAQRLVELLHAIAREVA